MPFGDLLPQKSSSYFALRSRQKQLRKNDLLLILHQKIIKTLVFFDIV